MVNTEHVFINLQTTNKAGRLDAAYNNRRLIVLRAPLCCFKTSVDQNISLMAQIAIESLDNYIPHESAVPAKLIEKGTTLKI